MIIYGIDPGATTGVAAWDAAHGKLLCVESARIHSVMGMVGIRAPALVIFEDARLRNWFGSTGPERWKGAGSIIRDCTIWEHFLADSGIAAFSQAPKAGKTKLSSNQFARITGWTARTNEHARDAAMLVYGLKLENARSILRSLNKGAA